MHALVNAKAALLQALLDGPGYGVALTRRVRERTAGHVRLGHGNVYTALRALERDGLVRRWTVVPGGRRGGRARLYHELTPSGVSVAERQRRALTRLVVRSERSPTAETVRRMQERLESCAGLSATVLDLRDRMREATS